MLRSLILEREILNIEALLVRGLCPCPVQSNLRCLSYLLFPFCFYQSSRLTVLFVANPACRIHSGYLRAAAVRHASGKALFTLDHSPCPPAQIQLLLGRLLYCTSPGVYGTRCHRIRQVLGKSTLRQGCTRLAGCHSHDNPPGRASKQLIIVYRHSPHLVSQSRHSSTDRPYRDPTLLLQSVCTQ